MLNSTLHWFVLFSISLGVLVVCMYILNVNSTHLMITYPRKITNNNETYTNSSQGSNTNLPQESCSQSKMMKSCLNSTLHGWCMDRQGNGLCVPGFLDGPFDPSVRCSNWWFHDMCLSGPLCRRTHVVPQPSVVRNRYHHPAPYNYRNRAWTT